MSLTRPNPLSTEVLGTLEGKTIDDQVRQLWRRIQSANDARQPFIEKQEKLLRQRRGIRKAKAFPWPGANNHNWPLIDAVCRRWKPGVVSLVLQSDPVAYFFPKRPEHLEAAPGAQDYYHWRFHTMTRVRETVMELADYVFQCGVAYTRQGWEYRTERQCRVARVSDLFPQGVAAAVEAYNQNIAVARAQAEAAIAAGQAGPEALEQLPSEIDAPTLIQQVLEEEYLLRSDNPLEMQQIIDAVEAILQGADTVKFYYQVVRSDKPCWAALDPLRVIVPPRCDNIEDAEYIAIEHPCTLDDLMRMAVDGVLNADRAAALHQALQSQLRSDPERALGPSGILSSNARTSITDVQDKADGINPGLVDEPERFKIYEVYCKIDIDDDGIKERVVLWYFPEHALIGSDKQGTVLALYPFPLPIFEWPIVEFRFEQTSPRPYSARGGAELLSVFQATVNKLHNARLDAIQITLAPMLVMRTTAGEENRNIRFAPGAIIPVTSVGDVAPLQMDASGLLQYLQEENFTKSMAEQYIGIFDPGIMAENAVDRRTAAEVDAVMQTTQSIFGQDAALFQGGMAKVHKQLWDMECEFGPEEVYYRVTGEAKPRYAKKAEIAFDFDIEPAGTPANTNQALARRKALEMIQLFGADMTGLIDKHSLYTNYFNVMDRNLGKLIVRPPEQAALVQQMFQLAAQANGGKPVAPTF